MSTKDRYLKLFKFEVCMECCTEEMCCRYEKRQEDKSCYTLPVMENSIKRLSREMQSTIPKPIAYKGKFLAIYL